MDPDIRYVELIDDKGKIIFNKIKEGKYRLTKEVEEAILAADLSVVRRIHEILDGSLGKISSIHITREKIHQLIFYTDTKILYVSTEKNISVAKLPEISREIESLVKSGGLA